MAEQKLKSTPQSEPKREGITRITVGGFKSISQEQSIEIRPLTILAGANSSGKSSIMQPLLLLKQTLEATYDPGALLLNGPNVRFTSVEQLLSRMNNGKTVSTFHVGIEVGSDVKVTTYFTRSENKGFDVERTINVFEQDIYNLYKGMPPSEVHKIALSALFDIVLDSSRLTSNVVLSRNRCFLTLAIKSRDGTPQSVPMHSEAVVGSSIRQIIHLPGLRGNPERNYPVTAVSAEFPGTFEYYVASVILQWQVDKDHVRLEKLNRDLIRLGLAREVIAKHLDATSIEVLVNRFIHSDENDTVSIADVGLGVSQALPVVVALHAANQGQLIYLEQPEIHLHPRAQSALAEVLANAALQGKRLIVETHSSLLLRGVQTLVAEGKLPPELVKLHWFTIDDSGFTQIRSADLDEMGAFGDWPEDFHTVTLDSERRYLDAAMSTRHGSHSLK